MTGRLNALRAREIRPGARGAEALRMTVATASIVLKNMVLRVMRAVLFRAVPQDPARVLVFRTGSLGDSLCATPALAMIRKAWPKAELVLLANKGGQGLVGPEMVIDASLYDRIIDYQAMGARALLGLLRQERIDVVVQLTQVDSSFRRLVRDMLFFRLVSAHGFGWIVSRELLFKKTLERHVVYPNEAERLAIIMAEHGLEPAPLVFGLNISARDEDVVTAYLREQGLEDRPMVAIAVGANSVKNRWPIGHFARVVEHFSTTHTVLLIGGPGDKELVKGIPQGERVIDTCGRFTPMQSAALLKRVRLALTNDTGPLHLSYAVGTPVVGLFASRDFEGKWFPPQGVKHRVFRLQGIACSMCFAGPCADNICMQAIKPEPVIAAMHELLN